MWSEEADQDGHHLTRISVDLEPADGLNRVSGVIGAADDGSYVYFTTTGQLVPGGPTGDLGGGQQARIFVWHEGDLHEVGGVDGNGGLARILASPEAYTVTLAKWSRVSPDGTHMAFVTYGSDELLSLYGKLAYEQGGGAHCNGSNTVGLCSEVYTYDATVNGGAGDLQCASCNPDGSGPQNNSDFYAFFTPGIVGAGTLHQNHVLSDDGRYVFFNTAESLLEQDTNGVVDAYRYDTETEEVALVSRGTGSTDSVFLDASNDGRFLHHARAAASLRRRQQPRPLRRPHRRRLTRPAARAGGLRRGNLPPGD
jgi:hypothetical protein